MTRARDRLLAGVVSWIPAAVLALLATGAAFLRLFPTRMQGPTGGAAALIGGLVDRQPLLVALVTFAVAFATVRYWQRWWWRRTTRAHDAAAAPHPLAHVGPTFRGSGTVSARRTAVGLASLLAIVVIARSSVVAVYRVASPSMTPTLNAGDRVLVNKLAYGFRPPLLDWTVGALPPRRGDIVVFTDPNASDGTPGPRVLVKRVLGLPGDRVAFRDGAVYINGWGVPACDAGPFVTAVGSLTVRGRLTVEFLEDRAYLTIRTPLDTTDFPAYRVPAGQLFVIGDDRGMSSDSRIWNEGRGGGVALGQVQGRVSRLAIGASPDGRLDLSALLPALALRLRSPAVDLRKTEQRIAACLAAAPRATSHPPPPP